MVSLVYKKNPQECKPDQTGDGKSIVMIQMWSDLTQRNRRDRNKPAGLVTIQREL